MLDGRFIEQGPAEIVLVAPPHEYPGRLLTAEPSAWPAWLASLCGASVLSATGLTKRYGAKTLFADLDLEVRAADRLAVLGPIGSGKTTVGHVVVGVTRTDAGQARRRPGIGPFAFRKRYQGPPGRPSRLDLITQQEAIDLLVEHAAERDCALPLVTHHARSGTNVAGDAVLRIGGWREPVA